MKHTKQVGYPVVGQVSSWVWPWIRSQVLDPISKEIRAKIGNPAAGLVMSQIGGRVRVQVGSRVERRVNSQVNSQVRDLVRDQVRAQVRAEL